jgi:hypothetical protein
MQMHGCVSIKKFALTALFDVVTPVLFLTSLTDRCQPAFTIKQFLDLNILLLNHVMINRNPVND